MMLKLPTLLLCTCLVIHASFIKVSLALTRILTNVSYDSSTGVCCDAFDSTECYTGSNCCGQWGNGGCFYDSNLCSSNDCGGNYNDTCDYGTDDYGNCLYICDYGVDEDGNCLPGTSCDYDYDYEGNCLPGANDGPFVPPASDGPFVPPTSDGPFVPPAGGVLPPPAGPKVPPAGGVLPPPAGPKVPPASGPVLPSIIITSPSTTTTSGGNGTISLLDVSVTPVVCKDIDFYYRCAQSYTVQASGSSLTLTPSSSAPSSCGVGTGDISNSSVEGSFPDGTTFQASVKTGNIISVNVPIVLQNITSCSGDYIVTSGEVLGVTSSSGGSGPPGGSVTHFPHPLAIMVMGGVVAAVLL